MPTVRIVDVVDDATFALVPPCADGPAGEPLAGSAPPQSLADEMHAAWVAFVASGDPGWDAYGPRRTVRRFDVTSQTVTDPDRELREIWDGVR